MPKTYTHNNVVIVRFKCTIIVTVINAHHVVGILFSVSLFQPNLLIVRLQPLLTFNNLVFRNINSVFDNDR